MKKTSALLALLLVLTGCNTTAAVDAPISASSTASSPVAFVRSEPGQQTSSTSSLPEMPAPDVPPVTAVGAIVLPQTLFTSTAGYSLELLTPAQYNMFHDSNRGGFRGFLTSDAFALGEGGKIAVANARGKIVSGFVFENNGSGWNAVEGIIPMKKDGKYGAISASDGAEVVTFQYDNVSPLIGSKLIQATTGDTTEVIDRLGKVIFTLDRGDEIYALEGDTLALHQDGMLKLYKMGDYSPINNYACEEIRILTPIEDANALIAMNTNDRWGICTADGKFVVEPSYDEIGTFAASYPSEYTDFTQNGKKGVLRRDGKVVVKPVWEDLVVYQRSVSVYKDAKWGAITDIDSGALSIEPMYDYIFGFGEDGGATFERNNKYGIIDREGNEMIAPQYETIISNQHANLEKGYYLLGGDGAPFSAGIIGGGKVILPNDNYIVPGKDGERYNLVMTPREKWGYVDRTGKFVIDAKFDNADAFIKGKEVAFVEQSGKISLIDRKGNAVLETVFSDVIGYNPETMVCAMAYTDEKGAVKSCLIKINFPA